ncbi:MULTISPECIES: SpvB/TcaC N-terminal domain-containing protein [unclassified Bradyrhizobium]|uniref:SpvB/TcaC N-terminal domain-containing protein n=1 Tax=unclassified Bradyrhizobium TaxID=2631580 RepID=UPI00143D15F1|nr:MULTISPECIES: SpvB/TcaC N-terminal domain-containing protein [unclassified Bradyrhizobium]
MTVRRRAVLSKSAAQIDVSVLVSCEEDGNRNSDSKVLNVTKQCASFSVLSQEPVKIEVPFDRSLLPDDVSPSEVQLFRIDYAAATIKSMDAFVDIENKKTVATLNDQVGRFFNGVLKSGERPERPPASFSTDSMKQLRSANPLGGISMVSAPAPNQTGELKLQFPIDLPAANRGELKPNFAVSYVSGSGYGNLGEGWSLSTPSISIETRWGVPVFDPKLETETYLFNGEQLVAEAGDFLPDAAIASLPPSQSDGSTADIRAASLELVPQPHRATKLRPRKTGKAQFVLRRDEGLWRFNRYGDDPAQYWWEAWQENGQGEIVKVMYFGKAPGRLPSAFAGDLGTADSPTFESQATLRTGPLSVAATPNAIVRWGLAREVDAFGNIIDYDWHYKCQIAGGPCQGPDTNADLRANDLYLTRVTYYGHRALEETILRCREARQDLAGCKRDLALYEVNFSWKPGEGKFQRTDGRLGGMLKSGDLLGAIDVRFRSKSGDIISPAWACSAPFVRYSFGYAADPLYTGSNAAKQRLTTVTKSVSEDDAGSKIAVSLASNEALLPVAGSDCSLPKSDAPLAGSQATTRFEYNNRQFVGSSDGHSEHFRLASSQPFDVDLGTRINALHDLFGLGAQGPFNASLLGSSAVSETTGGLYAGIALISPEKSFSAGFRYSFASRDGYLDPTLLFDVTGDGIPDLIIRGRDGYSILAGTLNSAGLLTFRDSPIQKTLPSDFAFQREPVHYWDSWSVEAHPFSLFFGISGGSSSTIQTNYLVDMDGDGKVDAVSPGSVLFNASRTGASPAGGEVKFESQSPYIDGLVRDLNPIPDANSVADNMTKRVQVPQSHKHPRYDTVRYWKAPFDGEIVVKGTPTLLPQPAVGDRPYGNQDGVIVSIERGSPSDALSSICESNKLTEQAGWPADLQNKCFEGNLAALKSSIGAVEGSAVTVRKGDVIAFRVDAIDNGSLDVIRWDPKVYYIKATDLNTNGATGGVSRRLFLDYTRTGSGSGEATQGLDVVLASLRTGGSDCASVGTKDETGASWPVGEADVGLCDPWGRSLVRYGASAEATPQASTLGAWSSPKTGKVNFAGSLVKPQTSGRVRLTYQLIDPPKDQNELDNARNQGSTKFSCDPARSTTPFQMERLIGGTSSWVPAVWMERDPGRYRLSSDSSSKTQLFVRSSQLLCIFLQSTIPASADDLQNLFAQSYGFWPEDGSRWKWIRSLGAGNKEGADPFTVSFTAAIEVVEQTVASSGERTDRSSPRIPGKGQELALSECFSGAAPQIYLDPAFQKLDAADREKFTADHPARLACRGAYEEYFVLPRFGAAVGSTTSFGNSNSIPPNPLRIERRHSEFRLAPDARSDSSILRCWAEPGATPLREYRFSLREKIVGGAASNTTLDAVVAQLRTSAYIRTDAGLMPLPVTPFAIFNEATNKTVPVKLSHLRGGLEANERAFADTRVAGEAVLQHARLRNGGLQRLAGTAFTSNFKFPVLPNFDGSRLPQILDQAETGYAICAPETGAQIVLETVIEDTGKVGEFDYAAAAGLSGAQVCQDAIARPAPTDQNAERGRICPIGGAVVEYPGRAPTVSPTSPLTLLAEDLVTYNQRSEALSPEGLRGWGGMAVRYEDPPTASGAVSPPIAMQASDLRPLATFAALSEKSSRFSTQLQKEVGGLQNGTGDCQLKPANSGDETNEGKCKDLSNSSGGAAVPVYPLSVQYRVPKATSDNSLDTPDSRQACQFNPRRNYPKAANMRAQLSVPDALKTLGRTTTFTSTDNAQIGAASEAMLDPSICSMGPDNAIWISDDLMSASRIGLKDLHIGVEKELSNVRAQIAAPTAVGLRGIAKLSTAEVHSEAASFSPGGISHSRTDTTTKTDIIDLNGDGFPDILVDGKIYFTGPGGYFRCGANSPWNGHATACNSNAVPGSDVVRNTYANTYGGSISIGSPPHTYPKDTNGGRGNTGGSAGGITLNEPTKGKDPSFATYGLTANLNKGASMRRRDFIDMNGDGLADLVEGGDCIDPLKDGEPSPCAVKVWLNLGYGFSNPVDWLGARGVLGERSNSTGFGISAGYSNSENDGGYQGGISANLNTSRQDRVLLDVNGDGLPDLVYLAGDKIKALLNTGTGFTANPVEIGTIPSGLKPGGLGRTEADSTSAGGAFSYFIPVWWLPPIYIAINPNVAVSDSVTRQPVAFRDVDGDGLPDLVVGEGLGNGAGALGFDNNKAEVVPNNLGSHGLLSGVFLPTNRTGTPNFAFEFRRTMPSDRDPTSHWVLSSISTNRGFSAADASAEGERVTCLLYGDGLHERFERRFLGFGRVEMVEGCRLKPGKARSLIEVAGDPKQDEIIDGIRKTVRHYSNGTVYESGLLLSEEVYDLTAGAAASRIPLRVIRNRYVLVDTALSSPARFVCHNVRIGRTDVLDAGLISSDRLPARCRDDLRPPNDDLENPLLDRSPRRLTPALVQTVRLTREVNSAANWPLRTAVQFKPDQYGRSEEVCDLGDLSGAGLEDEPATEPSNRLIPVTALRAAVCSKLIYETGVRPIFTHGASGGGTLLVEQRNLVREVTISSFAKKVAAPALDAPAAQAQEFSFGAADATDLASSSRIRVAERHRSAAYDRRTGARTALCSFENLNGPDPCEKAPNYPGRGASMLAASRAGVVKKSYSYDALGNLVRYAGPVGSRRTFVAKTYRYDRYLSIVESGEQTDYCRLGGDEDGSVPDPLFPPDAPCLDGVSEIGGIISRSVIVDYRHAVPTLSIDPNRNLLLTRLDGFGRPKDVLGSWASLGAACSIDCPDWSKAPFDSYLAGKFAGTNAALRPLINFTNRLDGDAGHSVGPTAIVTIHVTAGLYNSTGSFSVANDVLSLPTKHLFDQLGQSLQTISPAAVCEPSGEAWRPGSCTATAEFTVTGAVLKDRLFRPVQEFLPKALEGKVAADIQAIGYTIDTTAPSTKLSLDGFDRTLSTRLPDGNTYQFKYSVATEAGRAGAQLRHRTTARNSLCVPSVIDRDIRGNIRSVAEVFTPGSAKVGLGSSPLAGEVLTGANERIKSVGAADGEQQAYDCNDDGAIDKGVVSLTAYNFDALNQLVSVRLPNRVAAASLSAASTSDAAIQLGYDRLGRRLFVNDPDRGFQFRAYDAASNVVCDRYGPHRDKIASNELTPTDWAVETAGQPSPGAGPACRTPEAKDQARLTRVVQSSYIGPLVKETRYVWPQEPAPRGSIMRYGSSSDVDGFKRNVVGRVLEVEDNAGKALFAYDALGLPASTSRALIASLAELVPGKTNHVTTRYERDAWGSLAKTSVSADVPAFRGKPDDSMSVTREISQAYTVAGQLQSVSIASAGTTPIAVLKDVKYDSRGNVVRVQYENGVTTENRYNAASSRLIASSSQIGIGCNDPGASSDCVTRPSPILFQNLTYRYDPGGNVLTYTNKPRYRADCREISIGENCDSISPDDARNWGLLITGSDNAFRYDELNRVRSASKKIGTFESSAKSDPLTTATVNSAAPFELKFEETFSFLADHTVERMHRTAERRQLGSTEVRNSLRSLAYSYSDNADYPRHAPWTISRSTKEGPAAAQGFGIKMGFDNYGRMTAVVCDKKVLCAEDQLERRYHWYAEDTLRQTLAGKEKSEFTKNDKRISAWYDRIDSEYSFDGQRLYKSRNEEGWAAPPTTPKDTRLTDVRISDTLYLDPLLTVTRRGNGKPQALLHLFAGSARLASVWLPDKGGDETQVFTYHAQLQTRNVSDVLRSTLGKPQTARLHQQVEYATFGEILNERERSLDDNLVVFPGGGKRPQTSREAAGLPHYRFNGKEEDEAGIIDFGMRSYDNRLSIWLRPDPALGAYLSGGLNGGVYASKNLASYQFAGQNPISNVDVGGAYTCANEDCSMATIDAYPQESGIRSGLSRSQSSFSMAEPQFWRSVIASVLAGPNHHAGVQISFRNDVPGGPSTHRPMRTATARMVERAVIQAPGVWSVNINSSVGGHDAGRHPTGNAVDINLVNGHPVYDPGNHNASSSLFQSFRAQPDIDEYYGPDLLERMTKPGTIDRLNKPWDKFNTKLRNEHKNHQHYSRMPRNAEENTQVIAPPN